MSACVLSLGVCDGWFPDARSLHPQCSPSINRHPWSLAVTSSVQCNLLAPPTSLQPPTCLQLAPASPHLPRSPVLPGPLQTSLRRILLRPPLQPKMLSTTQLLTLVMAACLAGQVACRPRDTAASDDNDVELTAGTIHFPSNQYGSFVGEVQVSSDHLSVSRANRLKNTSSGPSASALVAGPPEGSEVSVGASVGSELSVGSSPGLSISGATLFFNNPAQVVPITP